MIVMIIMMIIIAITLVTCEPGVAHKLPRSLCGDLGKTFFPIW